MTTQNTLSNYKPLTSKLFQTVFISSSPYNDSLFNMKSVELLPVFLFKSDSDETKTG